MRKWRVGSVSMGAALVFLGIFLLLAQFFNWDPAFAVLSWWPILFIILGIEIIVYLVKSKENKPHVQYDFLSIIFISFIGTAGIGMALFSSSGFLDMAEQLVKAEVRTVDLPKLEQASLEGVERIVVDAGTYPLQIESTSGNELTMFGMYKERASSEEILIDQVEDYALVVNKGDTLYITLKDLPHQRYAGFYGDVEAKILIPSHIDVELNSYRSLNVKPRALKSDWLITNASDVKVEIDKNANFTLHVEEIGELSEAEWENMKKFEKRDEYVEQQTKSATLTIGKGTHTVTVKNVDHLEVK